MLDLTYTALEWRYRAQHPVARVALIAREAYMTSLYNYFAMPPVRADFCNVMATMARESLATPVTDPWAHSAAWLPRAEAAFQEFFRVSQHQGTEDSLGLGLTIVSKLTTLMGYQLALSMFTRTLR